MAARHTEVLADLGQRIVDGEYQPGDSFTLAWISEEYNVSRTVAREVMQQLGALGLISSSPRVGLVVRSSSHWQVFDPRLIRWRLEGRNRPKQLKSLFDLRLAVEPHAARLAASEATDAHKRDLRRLADTMVEAVAAPNMREFMEADTQFHSLILRASANEMFSALAPAVDVNLRWRTELQGKDGQDVTEHTQAHVDVVDAIEAGDPDKAFDAMLEILGSVSAALKI